MADRPDTRANQRQHLTLAEKLDLLFRQSDDPSLEAVARAIHDRGGPTISASYLWLLRTGKKDNPTLKHLEAIASYFGVPPVYFFDDVLVQGNEIHPELLVALREPDIRALVLRAVALSKPGRQAVTTLASNLAQIEAGNNAGRIPCPTEDAAAFPDPDDATGRSSREPSS
jgi:transcriptional regulator with XRE-family HTH domain